VPAHELERPTVERIVVADGLPSDHGDIAEPTCDGGRDPLTEPVLVDQLLASPHHGEKWARHWLDVVRYGETNSFERDGDKPNAWKYRDYVIRSLNEDKPYDQFIK